MRAPETRFAASVRETLAGRRAGGYVLVPVVVGITLIALMAFMLSNQVAIESREAGDMLQTTRAEHLARSGLEHALWRARSGTCEGDFTIPASDLGPDRYSAKTTGGGTTTAYSLAADQDAWIRNDDPTRNNGTTVSNHMRFESGKTERILTRFDLSSLPAGATIHSAVAFFYLKPLKPHPEGPITLHGIRDDWDESTVTWESFDNAFETTSLATIPAQSTGDRWVSVNLTGQVQAWVNGEPNFGILFDSASEGVHAEYMAREDGGHPPRLEVVAGRDPATPLDIEATGTLANGVTRRLRRSVTAALQPASVVELQPDGSEGKDAYLWLAQKTNNYGNDDETWVAKGPGNTARALFEFDLGAIPAGATILEATLSLHHRSGNDADVPVTAHRIMNPWSEDAVTWNRRESGTNWDTAGGDLETTVIASTDVGPASNRRYEWELRRLVQGWSDDLYPNYGVALETDRSGAFGERFDTSDHSDPTRRPRLTISYACVCGTSCMAPRGTGQILMVIGDSPTAPGAGDVTIRDILESWGYTVSLIQDDDSQGNFSAGVAFSDAVYISESVSSASVGTKLTGAAIGVVNAEGLLNDELGISTSSGAPVDDTVDVVDTDHYITRIFPAAPLAYKTVATELASVGGTVSPDARVLGEIGGTGGVVALETGAASTAGGTLPGRRVLLPTGEASVSWRYLTNEGRLLVQRAIAWAMGAALGASGDLLMVVGNSGSLTGQELARRALIESWSYRVSLIDANASQAEFDSAVAASDVAFVSEEVNASDLGTKLVDTTLGLVTEEANLSDEFGLSGSIVWGSGTALDIAGVHYITEPFDAGALEVLSVSESLSGLSGALAPGLETLGSSGAGPGLVAVDTGADLIGGGSAAGRRVQLPWGGNDMDLAHLNDDGRTIFERSLEWVMGAALTGPTAHWMLDEPGGTTAVDSEGGHDGTLTNGPSWAVGQHEGALDFDGNNDHIVVPHDDSLSLNAEMTFSAWINASSFGTTYQTILAKDDGGGGSNYWFGTWRQELVFGFFSGGTFREVLTTGLDLQTGTWYHLAASFENATGQVRLYVDGVEVHADLLGFAPSAVPADLTIGRSPDGEYWRGLLDDVRIYDRVLGSSEVDELATPGSSPPVQNILLVVGNAGGPATTDMGRMKLITDWGYTVTLFDDGESQAAFDAAVAANDVVFVTQTIGGGTLAHKLTGAPKPIVNEFPGKLDNFGFSQGTGLSVLASTFSASDPSHDISSPFGGKMIIALTTALAIPIPSGTLAPDLQAPTEISAQPALVTLETGAQRWDGGLAPARRVHLPLGSATIDQLTVDGRELMKRAIEWAGGTIGGGGGGGGGPDPIDPDPCAGTLADDFQTDDYTGSTGTLSWAGPWLEVSESDGAGSGDEQVSTWGTGNLAARLRDNDGGGEGLQREADLSVHTGATLSFRYWRRGLDNSNDYVRVEVSSDGGAGWTEIGRFQGPANDAVGSPQQFSHDLSSFISANTRIRLLTSPTMGGNDGLSFDDVQIELSGCAN